MLKVMPRTAGRIVIAVLHQHCCSLGERRTGSWHISGLGRWREAAVGKKAELGWCHITQEWLRRALVGRVISHAWRAPPGDFRFCACGPTLIPTVMRVASLFTAVQSWPSHRTRHGTRVIEAQRAARARVLVLVEVVRGLLSNSIAR
jgi:hypothetical protein